MPGRGVGHQAASQDNLATSSSWLYLGRGRHFLPAAIGALKMASASINAWALLLFLFLNRFHITWCSHRRGRGFAMIFGILRFLYGWSLKPLSISEYILLAISLYAYTVPI